MGHLRGSCGNSTSRFKCRTVSSWVIYAIIAAPMIAMLSHREINVDLDLDPVQGPAGAIGRAKALRYDAFEPELAPAWHTASPVDDAGARAGGTSKPLI